VGGVTYRDEIVIYQVMASACEESRPFLEGLKECLKQELEQEEILIVEREIETL
jgi:hypothetical protein